MYQDKLFYVKAKKPRLMMWFDWTIIMLAVICAISLFLFPNRPLYDERDLIPTGSFFSWFMDSGVFDSKDTKTSEDKSASSHMDFLLSYKDEIISKTAPSQYIDDIKSFMNNSSWCIGVRNNVSDVSFDKEKTSFAITCGKYKGSEVIHEGLLVKKIPSSDITVMTNTPSLYDAFRIRFIDARAGRIETLKKIFTFHSSENVFFLIYRDMSKYEKGSMRIIDELLSIAPQTLTDGAESIDISIARNDSPLKATIHIQQSNAQLVKRGLLLPVFIPNDAEMVAVNTLSFPSFKDELEKVEKNKLIKNSLITNFETEKSDDMLKSNAVRKTLHDFLLSKFNITTSDRIEDIISEPFVWYAHNREFFSFITHSKNTQEIFIDLLARSYNMMQTRVMPYTLPDKTVVKEIVPTERLVAKERTYNSHKYFFIENTNQTVFWGEKDDMYITSTSEQDIKNFFDKDNDKLFSIGKPDCLDNRQPDEFVYFKPKSGNAHIFSGQKNGFFIQSYLDSSNSTINICLNS